MPTFLPGRAYLAIRDFRRNLLEELSINPTEEKRLETQDYAIYGDLVYSALPQQSSYWNRTCLEKPFIATFSSIKEASDILRTIQRNWAYYPFAAFRRAELIKEKLPYINPKPRIFPYSIPDSPMGCWTLLDEKTIFASALTSSPLPCGEISFEEDHTNPPSRAYLKMYEALMWVDWIARKRGENPLQVMPNAHSKCVDAGACPGGWTWVFDLLGASVTAIDRSELAPALMSKPTISFIKHDAFTLKPSFLGKQDWVCSDVICYPTRLLQWIHEWIDSRLCENFICTIKMQGSADHEATQAFAKIPNSHVIHLTANKNELTWIGVGVKSRI